LALRDVHKFQRRFPGCEIPYWRDVGVIAKSHGIKAPGPGINGNIHGVHSLCLGVLKQFFIDHPDITLMDWSLECITKQHMALDAWLCLKLIYELKALVDKKQKANSEVSHQFQTTKFLERRIFHFLGQFERIWRPQIICSIR
jgi:hypothetical protein